jgi:hypothetical protein
MWARSCRDRMTPDAHPQGALATGSGDGSHATESKMKACPGAVKREAWVRHQSAASGRLRDSRSMALAESTPAG